MAADVGGGGGGKGAEDSSLQEGKNAWQEDGSGDAAADASKSEDGKAGGGKAGAGGEGGAGGGAAKKAPKDKEKKEKKEKKDKVKKEKPAKPHPSSKAGPNFSVKINDDKKVKITGVNKRVHPASGIADGDILLKIDGKDLTDLPPNVKANDIRNLLTGPCGSMLTLSLLHGGQPSQYDLYLDFAPLVKAIKGGKPIAKGESASISLRLVDTDVRRELFYMAGALQPLCKLLIDPKAAAQMTRATASLQNMLKFSMWDEIHIPLEVIGKPLVQMIEKGGLAKKMLAMDLMLRIALSKPTHRVLVSGGLVESCCALPKGIIPLCLPKWTPKGWKPGKKVTGLEVKAAKLLGSLARVDDETRERINNGTNNGITLLVRMMQGKAEPAGALNEISSIGQAVACEAIQYLALNPGCRSALDSIQAFDSLCALLALPEGAHTEMDTTDIVEGFKKYDKSSSGSLGLKEFESWYTESGRGDGRQAKAMFREVDYDNGGNISVEEMIEFVTRKTPAQVVDIYAASALRNSAVTEASRERLLKKGAVEGLVKMLAMHDDADRQRVAVLALVNFAFSGDCQERMADLGSVTHLIEILRRHGGKGEVACGAAMCLRQLCLLTRCQDAVAQNGGIEILCEMLRDKERPEGKDPVGNKIQCSTSAAAISALQNAVSGHEGACVRAIEAGVIGTIVKLLEEWIDVATVGLQDESDGDEDDEEDQVMGDGGVLGGGSGSWKGRMGLRVGNNLKDIKEVAGGGGDDGDGGVEGGDSAPSSPMAQAHNVFEAAIQRGDWQHVHSDSRNGEVASQTGPSEGEEGKENVKKEENEVKVGVGGGAVPNRRVPSIASTSAGSRLSFKTIKSVSTALSAAKKFGIKPVGSKAPSSVRTDEETAVSVHFPRSESDSKRSNGSQGGGGPQLKANLMDVEPDQDMIGEIADNEGRLTWTEDWWLDQEASVAERGAWLLHGLSFKNKEMLIASGARGVLQRVAYLSDPTVSPDYKGTNTAVTWASLALKQ